MPVHPKIPSPNLIFHQQKMRKGGDNELPIQYVAGGPPPKEHHSVRYYAHRVKESLTARISMLVCAVFLMFLLVVGIVTFVFWLSLRPHRPRIYMNDFSIPGLGQESGFENAEISFNVTARNSNQHIGIYYDSMEGAVYYRDQKIGSKSLLFPPYQQPKTTTIVTDMLIGATLNVNSQRWMEFENDRSHGNVGFRFELTSTIRFKVSTWNSKHHRMHANCNVGVGADGMILATSKEKRCPVYFT